jgi:site-specific recombinase XerD
MLLAQGVDGRVVMGLLGWSQASLLTRYQHVIDPLRRDAAQRIDQAYWPTAESP